MRNGVVYYTPVFAVSFTRKDYKAVVLDSTFSELIVVHICKHDQYTVLFQNTGKLLIMNRGKAVKHNIGRRSLLRY